MRRRGKTFLSLFLSAVIVTGQPVLAADFSAGEETFISETTEQEGDVSEASAIFEDTRSKAGKLFLPVKIRLSTFYHLHDNIYK